MKTILKPILEFNDVMELRRNKANFKLSKQDLEFNDEPSLTVPDEAHSVKQILEKFVSGIPLSISQDGKYESEVNFDSVDVTRNPAFDLTDAEAEANDIEKRYQEAKALRDAERKLLEERLKKQREDDANELAEYRKSKTAK